MLQNEILMPLFSLLVGVVVTFIVARYFFMRSTKTSLDIFVQSASPLFGALTPDVRRNLKIEYQGVEVNDLQEFQFLVANTGHTAIRDIISPLIFSIPDRNQIVDAAILHVNPNGRTIKVESKNNEVRFGFNLLNADEYFIARILIKGYISVSDAKFFIEAENIPPNLDAIWATPNLIRPDIKHKPDFTLLVPAMLFSIIAWAIFYLIYMYVNSGLQPLISFQNLAILILCVPGLICAIGAVSMLMAIFVGDFSFPPKKTFTVPSSVLRSRYIYFLMAKLSLEWILKRTAERSLENAYPLFQR